VVGPVVVAALSQPGGREVGELERKRDASEEYCNMMHVFYVAWWPGLPLSNALMLVAAALGPRHPWGLMLLLAAVSILGFLRREHICVCRVAPGGADAAASGASPVPGCQAGSVGFAVFLLRFLGLLAVTWLVPSLVLYRVLPLFAPPGKLPPDVALVIALLLPPVFVAAAWHLRVVLGVFSGLLGGAVRRRMS